MRIVTFDNQNQRLKQKKNRHSQESNPGLRPPPYHVVVGVFALQHLSGLLMALSEHAPSHVLREEEGDNPLGDIAKVHTIRCPATFPLLGLLNSGGTHRCRGLRRGKQKRKKSSFQKRNLTVT